jgi:hypothetical protein
MSTHTPADGDRAPRLHFVEHAVVERAGLSLIRRWQEIELAIVGVDLQAIELPSC